MNDELILEMNDRRSLRVVLAAPFEPDSNQVQIITPSSHQNTTYRLSEVSCLRLKHCPPWAQALIKEGQLEEIETTAGLSFFVRVPENQQFQTGFFASSIAEKDEFPYVFFCFVGTKSRKLFSQIGEILERSGTVSRKNLDQALEQQKKQKSQRLGELITEQRGISQQTIDETLKRMMHNKMPPRSKIGDILVNAQLVTREQIDQALAIQKNNKSKPLGALLIELGLVSEEQILVALASKFRMEYVGGNELLPTDDALKAIAPEMIKQLRVLPLEDLGNRLVIAISDPANQAALVDVLRFHANRRVELVVARQKDIDSKIEEYYEEKEEQVDDIISNIADDALADDIAIEEEQEDLSVNEADSKLIRLLNKILLDGFRQKASDIHFEPGSTGEAVKIRYRIDGTCSLVHSLPAIYSKALISRIKIMANLDIAEHRRPQSGKIVIRYRKKRIEFRVEITPTIGGREDAVLRILSTSHNLGLADLDLGDTNLTSFQKLISQPYGFILCVGPTGSGKTTTLHAALAAINEPDRKIWTAEDPVEITQEGLRQVQVNTKIGFTFEEALRSFLRADPDVIMIGEMRDKVTAKTAVEASLTGHLVFSTLHTNSACETITRLFEMGLEPFHFADVFLGIIAQRLALKLCTHCKSSYQPSQEEFDSLVATYGNDLYMQDNLPEYADAAFMQKNGCEHCSQKGYAGRMGIHELLVGTPELKNAIRHKAAADELQRLGLAQGMRTLAMDGIAKMLRGLTDINQVNRVVVSN